jgi:uncharacterized membrane protein
MRRSEAIVIAIILASLAVSLYFYPRLPEMVASHWNERGEVDGYMPRFWGAFLMPAISLGLLLLFMAIPRIDPLRKNIEKFRRHYDAFVVLIVAFFLYIHVLTLLLNTGFAFSLLHAMVPALAALFYYSGVVIQNARRNWFIGIRTPWTLSSERVWNSTHRIGGKLFKAAGLIALLGLALPDYAILLIIGPVLLFTAYLIVYSYLEYRKEEKH